MSTLIAALVFLPAAPAIAAVLHWRACRAEERRNAHQFAEEVEIYLKVRGRG